MSDINLTDDELEGLMAELEEQNAQIAAASASVAAKAASSTPPTVAPTAPPTEPTTVAAEVLAASEGEAVEGGDAVEEEELAELAAELERDAQAVVPEVHAATVTPVVESEAVASPPPWENSTEPDANCVTLPDGSCVGGLNSGKEPCMHDMAREALKPKPKRPTADEVPTPGLQHYVDVDQFRTDTRVTEATLDTCMIEQNGLRAYYGAQAARAEAQHARLKVKFEVIEATLYDKHRKALAASGEKTTEKMVENAVKLDPRWLKAKNLVIEAETVASINKSLVESLKDRRDMIIQLGADRRDEYKGQARVLAEQQERDELRERARAAMQGRAA